MNLSRLMDSFPGRVFRKFNEDQGPKQATLIAWNTLFAAFPMLVFAASILGFVLREVGFKSDQFYIDVLYLVPDPKAQVELLKGLNAVRTQTGLLFVIGLAGMLWGGSNLFGTMEDSFAVIYHTTNRGMVKQKLVAFAMMFLFTALAGAVVLTSALLPLIKYLPFVPLFLLNTAVAFVLQLALGLVAGFILFLTIYFVVPNRSQRLRQVLPGAVTSAVLFEVLTLVFPLYLSLNHGMNAYGSTFGLLFVLLTFFYFLGLIVMVGVEVNSVLYPVPVEQPNRPAALAPPQSGPEGEEKEIQPAQAPASRAAETDGAREPARGRVRTVLALVVGSALGVLVGRRTRSR